MQHNEMIQPSNFGVISRTCLFCLAAISAVLTMI